MRATLPHLGFPLLLKELIEQAQRKRTYLLRVVAALLLYTSVLVMTHDIFIRNLWDSLGTGRKVLEGLFMVTAWGIYLIVPALTCGAIAGERERETWQLLLVTRLGKWTILFEKYFSRIFTAFTFLILTIPLMAVAYPLGGITTEGIIVTIWSLTLCLLYVTATGICCSAWCHTIAGAFITTYILMAAWLFIPILTVMSFYSEPAAWLNSAIHKLIETFFPELQEAVLVPFVFYWDVLSTYSGASVGKLILSLFFNSIPILIQTFILLLLARRGLDRPVENGGTPLWKKIFAALDAWFKRINQNRITRGREIFIRRSDLPVEDPVAWRERSRALLNHPAHRIRIFVGIIALLMVSFILGVGSNAHGATLTIILGTPLFGLGCLMLSVTSASIFSRERSRQTLDVLLGTPLSSSEILRQKLSGIYRWYRLLIGISLAILFMTVYLNDFFMVDFQPGILSNSGQGVSLTLQIFLMLIYIPPLIIWVSVAIGLFIPSQSRAIMASLGLFVVSTLIGIVCADSGLLDFGMDHGILTIFGSLLSPAFLFVILGQNGYYRFNDLLGGLMIVNTLWYLGMALAARRWVLKNLAFRLGRLEVLSFRPEYPSLSNRSPACETPNSGS